MTIKRDDETVWGDEQGFMWSWWLFDRFTTLVMKNNLTPDEELEMDMIIDASIKGRKALEEIEQILKEGGNV